MWLGALMSTIAVCCQAAVHDLERQRFLGDWEVIEATDDGKPFYSALLAPAGVGTGVGVRFRQHDFTILADDWPAKENSTFPWSLHPWDRPCVFIFWYEGIYEFRGTDELWICAEYHGQGVEGEAAKRWRRPEDFVVREGQRHVIIGLKRKGTQAEPRR